MSDWSDFGHEVKAQRKQSGGLCGVRVLMKTLSEDARHHVETAIDNQGLSAAAIERGLRARIGDDAPSAWVIRAHRRGECRCGKGMA